MEDERETQKPALKFICPYCGNQLEPRTFDTGDGFMYGIFDNCQSFSKQMIFETLKEAIEAFSNG